MRDGFRDLQKQIVHGNIRYPRLGSGYPSLGSRYPNLGSRYPDLGSGYPALGGGYSALDSVVLIILHHR